MLHRGRCHKLVEWLQAEAVKARRELEDIAGWKVNPDSANQLGGFCLLN